MSDTWRYRCPNGHSSFRRCDGGQNGKQAKSRYYCNTCRQYGENPHHDFVVDMKNDEAVVHD